MRSRNPLLSTYRAGENRVTASMLAVFERIDLALVEAILGAATGEASLQMVSFTNQPPGAGKSVPDGRISAHFALWIETKTEVGAVRADQLAEHLRCLDDSGDQRLLVITPDPEQPQQVTDLADARVLWFNFLALSDAIDQIREADDTLVGERERLLLAELQALLVEDGLLDFDDTVVVAARVAYPEYLAHGVYACQTGRTFRTGLTHMGFYADGAIQPEVAAILDRIDPLPLTQDEADARRAAGEERVAEAVEALLATGTRAEGESYQLFVLSRADDAETVTRDHAIKNDTRAASGRRWAWTLGQRYARLDRLREPAVEKTSQL